MRKIVVMLAGLVCAVQAYAAATTYYTFAEFKIDKVNKMAQVTAGADAGKDVFSLPVSYNSTGDLSSYYSVYTLTDDLVKGLTIGGTKYTGGTSAANATDIAKWLSSNMADAKAVLDVKDNHVLMDTRVQTGSTIMNGAPTQSKDGDYFTAILSPLGSGTGQQTEETVHGANPWTVIFYYADGDAGTKGAAAEQVIVLHANSSTKQLAGGKTRGTNLTYDGNSGWVIPEPTSGLLMLLGLAGLALKRKRA